MKSVIEGLFAGLLENTSFSDKSKKNKSDNEDGFSSDINHILLSTSQENINSKRKTLKVRQVIIMDLL